MIKLFVSDMDGTLLNERHAVSDKTAQAVRDLESNGIEFIIATGRSYNSAQPLLTLQELQPNMINLNGAVFTEANGTTHDELYMDFNVVSEMINYLESKKIGYSLMTASDYYMANRDEFVERIQKYINAQVTEKYTDIETEEADSSTAQFLVDFSYVHHLNDYNLTENNQPLKMMVLSDDTQAKKDFLTHFQAEKSIDVTSSGPDNLEITDIKAQKGIALQNYINQKGYTMDEVATIGDSLNDRSMLQMAKYSFAMDNASNEVKEMAKYLAPSHRDDGVANTIYKILNGDV